AIIGPAPGREPPIEGLNEGAAPDHGPTRDRGRRFQTPCDGIGSALGDEADAAHRTAVWSRIETGAVEPSPARLALARGEPEGEVEIALPPAHRAGHLAGEAFAVLGMDMFAPGILAAIEAAGFKRHEILRPRRDRDAPAGHIPIPQAVAGS